MSTTQSDCFLERFKNRLKSFI